MRGCLTHRRRTWRFAALLGLLIPLPHAAAAAPTEVPGELLVKFRADAPPARRARAVAALPAAVRQHAFDFIRTELVTFSGMSTPEAVARLSASPDVEYAEPNYVITADVIPNDPGFPQLWGMKNTGQGGAYAGDDIDAALAWDITTGDPNLKIGIIDTGIDYTHPDLAANIWTNPGEIPGNGRDDDNNGYVDDVHGYDVLNHDGDPMDDGTHGTHVAGTVAAVGNNGVGVTGVLWHCKLVAIKFMTANGLGTESDAIAAIQYSLAVGVKVTNNSWGNMPGGQALMDAINAAGATGQLMIFAAGNNGWNIDMVPVYPPSWVLPNMITVAATDGRDLRPTFSNYGASTVNLGAPGYGIYSCQPGGLYQTLNGTSMAAPHVTGVVALALGHFPYATPQQIRQLVLSSVDLIASMNGMTTTGGRLNAYKTLINGDAVAPGAVNDLAVADVGSTALDLAWTAPGDDGATGTATRYDLRMATTPITPANFGSATPVTVAAPKVAGSPESAPISGLGFTTTYYFAVRAVDDFGNPGPVSNVASGTTLGVPHCAASPAAITLAMASNQTADVILSVSNSGQGRLDFSAAPSPSGAWLGTSPASGRVPAGAAVQVTVHVDAAGLADGAYPGTVQLTSNDPAAATTIVPVNLTVGNQSAVGVESIPRLGLRVVSPNPGPAMALELSLPAAGSANLDIFDVRGARVRSLLDGALEAGPHRIQWNAVDDRGTRVPTGVYFVRARAAGRVFVERVLILR